jgi:hypothetical protein
LFFWSWVAVKVGLAEKTFRSESTAMIINKDTNGNPIGFIEKLISNERIVTVDATANVTTVTTRDRNNGRAKSETSCGTLPFTAGGDRTAR